MKDNQINIIRIKLDSNIVSEFYHPDIITKSVKTATKGKSLPIEIWSEISQKTIEEAVARAERCGYPTYFFESRWSNGIPYKVTVKEQL